MKKINLDNVQEFTRFKNPVGGFICEIKSVEDFPEKEYLRIGFDIAEAVSDDQKEFVGMYEKRKKERDFDYPKTIVSYKESNETALRFFKGFVTAIETSNEGYKFQYEEQTLVGKRIGFVIGEEEYEGKDKNGMPKVKVRIYVASRHSVQAIRNGDFEVPEFKKLSQPVVSRPVNPFEQNVNSTPIAPDPIESGGFEAVDDDDCPF